MTSLARVFAVAAVVALAIGAGAIDARVSGPAAAHCPAASLSSDNGGAVATITHVLHSKVYVDTKFVGTVPFDIVSGDRICTNESGQAVFDLSPSRRAAACIVLPGSALTVFSGTATPAIDFESGSAWCALRRGDASVGASTSRLRRIAAETPTAIVGVVVAGASTTIKVWSGKVSVYARTRRLLLKASRQVRVSALGTPGAITAITVGTADKIAVAKLRLAQR
jgi:hypothetical protein